MIPMRRLPGACRVWIVVPNLVRAGRGMFRCEVLVSALGDHKGFGARIGFSGRGMPGQVWILRPSGPVQREVWVSAAYGFAAGNVVCVRCMDSLFVWILRPSGPV